MTQAARTPAIDASCIRLDSAAPPSAKVSAATALLKIGREGIELDDLAARVDTLEQAAKAEQKKDSKWR